MLKINQKNNLTCYKGYGHLKMDEFKQDQKEEYLEDSTRKISS